MSGHTPGPWEYSDRRPTIEARVNGQNQTVATLLTFVRWNDKENGYDDTRPERDANARLIAAAPDMLAALKGVLGIARAATMHSGGEHNRKRIAAAEAAIAKAEGRP